MKVTTELKNLINRQFDSKVDEIRKKAQKEVKKLYDAKVEEFTSTKEWKDYVKAADKLSLKFEEMFPNNDDYRDKPYYPERFKYRVSTSPSDFVRDNTYSSKYNTGAYQQAEKDIQDLLLKKEALLIKLAYEKDFDKIQAMLAEFGITL